MARNRPNPLDDPPAASSSEEHHEEEEEDDDTEEEEEVEQVETGGDDDDKGSGSGSGSESESSEEEQEEEEEVKKEEVKKITPATLPKNPNPESDDETESDTDSRSPGLSAFTIRKNVDTTPASVKPKKPALEVASLKRPAPEGEKKDSRAKKAKAENGEQEVKKSTIQVWSEDDAVAVLEAMVAFAEEKGVDPMSDGGVFHEYVKDKLSVETSTMKLMEKIRRMKKKYVNHPNCENGADPVFSKPNDKKSWELSKKIWGGGGIAGGVQSKRSSSKKKKPIDNGDVVLAMECPKEEAEVASRVPASKKKDAGADVKKDAVADVSKNRDGDKKESFSKLYPFLNLSLKNNSVTASLISKDGAETMEGCLRCLEKSKLEELEGEWKKQILAEADVVMRRHAILQKQIGLVSDQYSQRG